MIQITVNGPGFYEGVQAFEHEFPACKFVYGEENFQESTVLFGGMNVSAMHLCPHLKWVQTGSSGVDGYMQPDYPTHVKLTTATGGYNLAISEYMLATTLSLFQNLPHYRDAQHQQTWKGVGKVAFVKSSTVLMIGLGNIGRDYAKLVKAMGAYVIGIRRTVAQKPDYIDELYQPDALLELLPRADVVAIATPSTGDTKKMMDKTAIAAMKQGAILLNIGRGNIIETDAMVQALQDGKLGGAALDVTDPEPLPKGHPLWEMDNVIITPHISGGFSSHETRDMIVGIFKENLKRFLADEPLLNQVDFAQGYTQTYTE